MSSDKGFVKIYRDLQDHWIWEDKPFRRGQAWVDLIMMMNHKDRKIFFNSNAITVKRGSAITSIRKLSERWGWSKDKVKHFLGVLQQEGMIQYESDTQKTLIILVGFSEYQGKPDTHRTPTGHQSDADRKRIGNESEQTRMIKNDKERKERKEELPPEDYNPWDEPDMTDEEALREGWTLV